MSDTQRSPVGPKSLQWCRENIQSFARSEAITERIRAEEKENREKLAPGAR